MAIHVSYNVEEKEGKVALRREGNKIMVVQLEGAGVPIHLFTCVLEAAYPWVFRESKEKLRREELLYAVEEVLNEDETSVVTVYICDKDEAKFNIVKKTQQCVIDNSNMLRLSGDVKNPTVFHVEALWALSDPQCMGTQYKMDRQSAEERTYVILERTDKIVGRLEVTEPRRTLEWLNV